MWGFQSIFRVTLEGLAERALETIGTALAPRAYLVGFREQGNDPWPICIEPESGPFHPDELSDALKKGQEIYEEHPRRNTINTDPGVHERFHAGLLDRSRADAIAIKLSQSPSANGRIFFVGRSGVIGNYRIFPVIGVVGTRWNSLPTLNNVRPSLHTMTAVGSLQEAVIKEILQTATRAMFLKAPPEGLWNEDEQEINRRASTQFITQLSGDHAQWGKLSLRQAMDAVSAQPYEGRTGVGTIALGKKSAMEIEVELSHPFQISRTRVFRKALEMTDQHLQLLTDGSKAFGLGRLKNTYNPKNENCFTLTVVGRGAWELAHLNTPLIRVEEGIARLPKPRLSRDKFFDAVERLFPHSNDAPALWNLALSAAQQAHGTMLVVHIDALGEAERLGAQAMAIHPTALSAEALLAVSSIDGAVLVDPMGHCHAVGVILDGVAVEGVGDAARGARYNSAHRYLHTNEGRCLIIIVSEDGMISLIPNLPRRVHRDYVEQVLTSMESAASEEKVNFEEFHRIEDHVQSLAFYLSAEQCSRANAAREMIETKRGQLGGAISRIEYKPLTPDPRMNDSYFLS